MSEEMGQEATVPNSGQTIAFDPEKMSEVLEVVNNICQGKFASRIINVTTEDGIERELCLRVNEMIDRADAYIRESTACMGFILQNQYFRRISPNGMLGDYNNAVVGINNAADGIETKMVTFGEIVGTVASASTELNNSAQAMGETANQANNRATTVAAAAEEAGVNTSTVAASAEQLNASIQEINRQVSQSAIVTSEAVIEVQKTNELVDGLSVASTQIEASGHTDQRYSQTNKLACP